MFTYSTIKKAAAPMTGGVNCPLVEDATSTAPAFSRENPIRFINGIVNVPVVTVLAMEDPDIITENTPLNIRAFMVFKAETQNRKFGTADRIRSAMKNYYKEKPFCRADGWNRSDASGNPADCLNIKHYLQGLKKKKISDSEQARKAVPLH